jgi:hypothetical protein
MPRHSREVYWTAILADFRRSGLTQDEFCRRRQISLHSFRHWLYRRRPDLPTTPAGAHATPSVPVPAPSSPPRFLPVRIRCQPGPTPATSQDGCSAPMLELVLADHRRIRVPAGFDPLTLQQLLDILEHRP